jgi:cation transport ATPase
VETLFTRNSQCFRHGVVYNPFPEEEYFDQSVAYVAVDGALAGLICFEDKLREDSHQVVDALSKHGISVYMLSGDKKSAAMNVASIVGIQEDKVISVKFCFFDVEFVHVNDNFVQFAAVNW